MTKKELLKRIKPFYSTTPAHDVLIQADNNKKGATFTVTFPLSRTVYYNDNDREIMFYNGNYEEKIMDVKTFIDILEETHIDENTSILFGIYGQTSESEEENLLFQIKDINFKAIYSDDAKDTSSYVCKTAIILSGTFEIPDRRVWKID